MILYHHLLKLFGQVSSPKSTFWLLVKLNSPMQMLVFSYIGNGVNNGQAIDSGYSINDLSAPSSNVLYSSSKISQIFNHKCLFFQVYLLHLQLILRLIFYMLVLMDHLMFGMVLCIIMFL